MIRRLVAAAFVLSLASASAVAHADDAACFAAAERGQELRNAGKLIDARERLIACANRKACPEVVASECARWLAEVDERMPTVVFAARDEAGADLLDVRVSIDDASASAAASSGQPVTLDPGPHKIRFERNGANAQEQTIVVRAGEKNRPVTATFTASTASTAAPVSSPPRAASSPSHASEGTGLHVPVTSWVLAGVSVIGFGVFGYFGASGVSDYERFGCDVGCAANDKSKVDTAFVVADIGLGVGIVSLAGAIVTYLVSPKPTTTSAR